MYVTWILVGIALGAIFFAVRYREKWKDLQGEYDKRCNELTNALGEVWRLKLLNEDVMKENKALSVNVDNLKKENDRFNAIKSDIESWIGLLDVLKFDAFKYLCVMEERYFGNTLPPATDKRAVSVAIRHPKAPKLFIIIKDFWFDKNNKDDYEFAKREAEELLETIIKF